jgi:hypothetical protein
MPSPDRSLESVELPLSAVVNISRQFLRSVRIDADVGRDDALSGYVCQGTARALLENMARQVNETRQRAFTWTGPYGGGKSSLALMLCSLVGGNPNLRDKARKILDLPSDNAIHKAFSAKDGGWLVVPVVGKRASIAQELHSALAKARNEAPSKRKQPDVVSELVNAADAHAQGVLVVIDELGKMLEAAAQDADDIYIFQELAEAASRSNGKLIIVGILHQAFDAYASRLGRQSQDDWAKVQGRFVDIPLVSATDEVVELIGKAIEITRPELLGDTRSQSDVVAKSLRTRRPSTPIGIGSALAKCWPLHPITASLLGPISKRRFGQNERSTFGFLASREPLGFIEFLDSTSCSAAITYGPARYWDYLKANLEPSIIASPDGHRWAVACDAVERAEAKGEELHVEVTKVVALIEMFRNGSGLVPEEKLLSVAIPSIAPPDIHRALGNLVSWKILIERKHLGAYGVYAGSDFDIDAAVTQARYEIGTYALSQVSALSDLQPILAKRLYQESGTMRWFGRQIIRLSEAQEQLKKSRNEQNSVGTFFLCLPELGQSSQSADNLAKKLSAEYGDKAYLFGIPANAETIGDLSLELAASERVMRTRPELEGDSVAKRELTGRISAVKSSLEEELTDAFGLSKWYFEGHVQVKSKYASLSVTASAIAKDIFHKCPRILSELINREELSSNSSKARKELLYRMISNGSEANLGYTSHPADAGLYYTVLQGTGVHAQREGAWAFGEPVSLYRNQEIRSLWWDTREFLLGSNKVTTLQSLYSFWGAPPYGIRSGLMPVLALAFFLSNRSTLAMYIDGAFTPDVTEAAVDEWLLDPARIRFQFVEASKDKVKLVSAIAKTVAVFATNGADVEPLDAARGLVSMVVNLPAWTRRTSGVSQMAQDVRAMLMKANDPHKVIFADLPTVLGATATEDLVSKLKVVTDELFTAYPKMLATVREKLISALDHVGRDVSELQKRAAGVKGITGDFLLDAFATRLETYASDDVSIEKIISLATSKPPAQWVDRDIDAALTQIGSWAIELRKQEAMAPLHGRPASRRVIGVVFGAKNGQDASGSIDIAEQDVAVVDDVVKRILAMSHTESRDVLIAALAEAGALLMTQRIAEKS